MGEEGFVKRLSETKLKVITKNESVGENMGHLNSKISNLKSWILRSTFACTLILLFSCSQISSISVNDDSDDFDADFQSVNQKMDILWMIDGSVSMKEEIESVQRNILSFIEQYIKTGYDFKIGVLRTTGWSQYLYNMEQSLVAAQKAFDHANEAHGDGGEGVVLLSQEEFVAGFQKPVEENLSETIVGVLSYFVKIYDSKIEAFKKQIEEIETECSSDTDCNSDLSVLNSLADPDDLYRPNTTYSPAISSPLGMRLKVLKGHQKTLEAHKQALDSIEALKANYDPIASNSAFESALGDLERAIEKIKVDGTNGVQNHMIPGLNIFHSGQSINDLDDDDNFTSLTGAPILDLGTITEADKQAVNVNFCDCRYIDFNFDGDFDDVFLLSTPLTMVLETYEGHEIDFNGDGDFQDVSSASSFADETKYNIDFNRDGDKDDTDLEGISEFVEGWTQNLNQDKDSQGNDIISTTLISVSDILNAIEDLILSEKECENPYSKTNRKVDLNQDGDFRNGAFPDIIFDWDENIPLDESVYGIDFDGDGDIITTEFYLDINDNGLENEVGLVVSEESVPLPTCVIFDDPGDPMADTWITRNPDSFLSKFSRNIDVYGLRAGQTHGGFLNPTGGGRSFDNGVRYFHGDEREFQSITAFFEYGDRSVELSKELFEMYKVDDEETSDDDKLYSFWRRFEDVNWEDSKPSNFFRKGAFLAIIIVTDEMEGSRFHLDAQLDNGSSKRKVVPTALKINYPDSCDPSLGASCEEPDPIYITSNEFIDFISTFVKGKECQKPNLSEEQQCRENFSNQEADELYSIYIITKSTDSERFNVLRDVAESSGGLSLDIDKDFGQQLKRISVNIVESTSVYMLKRLAQKGTIEVSWTWASKEEDTLLVPYISPKGFTYTPSQSGEKVSHLQVTIPEVNYDESENSILDGFSYNYEGNFIRIQGSTYLPFQGARLYINYTPRSLEDAN